MSNAQELFRQKRAEKGSNKPNWKELKAKKLQQQAQEQKKAVVAAASAPPSFPKPAPATAPPASRGLPSDFFQNKSQQAPSKLTPAPAAKPSVQTVTAAAAAAAATNGAAPKGPSSASVVVPKGFFADAEADAKVRGEKLPTKQDKEDEFKEFQKLMEEQINVAAQVEAQEAAQAAEDRREREEFEQMMRLKLLYDLRHQRDHSASGEKTMGAALPGGKEVLNELVEPDSRPNLEDVALPVAKRRRVIDVLREELEGGEDEESDGEEDGNDIDSELLNWRAKTV